MASGKKILLSGGAQAKNIFWQVSGGAGVVIGTTAHFEGIALAATAITLNTGASFNGRLFAQTRVNLDGNLVANPQYTLTYTAGLGGSISGVTPQVVNAGDDGTLVTAVADPGFIFVQWSDGVLTAGRTDLNVSANITAQATFIGQYTLTYTAGLGGSISGVTPQVVNAGDDGTLVTAVADPGFIFVQWSDGVLTAGRTDLNVSANITAQATFSFKCGTVVTLGAIMELDLSGVPANEAAWYSVTSSDESVMTAAITPTNQLRLEALGRGSVDIEVTTFLGSGSTTRTLRVGVVGDPRVLSSGFPPHESWNPRFEQRIEVLNDSGCDAIGLRLLFSDLDPGFVIENQTGLTPAPDGRPMIEYMVDLPYGAMQQLSVIYLSTGSLRPDQHPPTVEVEFILPNGVIAPEEGYYPLTLRIQLLDDGRVMLEFESTPGRSYQIDYTDALSNAVWVTIPVTLEAGGNRTQWIDSGPPMTTPKPSETDVRFYRVRELLQ